MPMGKDASATVVENGQIEQVDYATRIEAMERTLYRVSRTLLSCDADCQDAVQEAIIKGYTRLHQLRNPQFFNTWMVRILINECYSILRTHKRVMPVEEVLTGATYDMPGFDPDVHDALMALDDNCRTAIVLFYIEGYSVAEIARIAAVPQGTIKSRLSRGRNKLRVTLTAKEAGGYDSV